MSVTVENDNYDITLDKEGTAESVQHAQDSAVQPNAKQSASSKAELLPLIAEAAGVDFLDLSTYTLPDKSIPYLIGEKISRKFEMLALEKKDNTLLLAMKDPKNIFAIDSATLITNLDIKPVMVDPELLKKLTDEVFYVQPQVQQQPQPQVQTQSGKDKDVVQTTEDEKKPFSSASIYKAKLGNILISQGVINEEQLQKALEIQKESGEMLGSILVKEGFLSKEQLYNALEVQIGVKFFDLKDIEISEDVIKLVDRKLAKSYNLIPIKIEDNSLVVAMSDPANIYAIDDLRLATGYEVTPVLADGDIIAELIETYYKQEIVEPEAEPEVEQAEEFDIESEIEKVKEEIEVEVKKEEQVEKTINISDVENAPIVRLVNVIFKSAVDKGASDIHIEAYEDCVVVRYRIDGQLTEVMRQDKKIQQVLVARIKIISGLDIAEKRIPQDGRVTLKINGKNYDFRVSTLPTIFGEKVVIRILDKEGFNRSKNELGFFEDDLVKFDSILAHPHGIVLVTGPTGSGKSTTLYTALRELCKPNVNILTVEDPVEATIRGVNQVQVNAKAGMTFASALRAFLRQDPDIIMVGEIRDRETAEIAVRAAITGHLVLSTLHTNDSVSSIARLEDMGVEPFLIASSLVGVLAQRLVRRLCPKCKEEYIAKEHEMKILKVSEETKIYRPVGCPECNGTGYKGRIAAYEILTITPEMRDMISRGATTEELTQMAIKEGMKTLADSCSRLVLAGITSLEEMMNVVAINY